MNNKKRNRNFRIILGSFLGIITGLSMFLTTDYAFISVDKDYCEYGFVLGWMFTFFFSWHFYTNSVDKGWRKKEEITDGESMKVGYFTFSFIIAMLLPFMLTIHSLWFIPLYKYSGFLAMTVLFLIAVGIIVAFFKWKKNPEADPHFA